MIPPINLQAQYLAIKDEIDQALLETAGGAHFILGPHVQELEKKIAVYCGCRFGVGVASGTDALLLSLVALDIGPGDEVITTPFSFMATADAIVQAGATPVFVDIDPATYNIDAGLIPAAITTKTKAIMPVHLYGQATDMSAIMKIAARHKLAVIEDAAQAIGAEWLGQRVGSFGQAGALSFFPTKNLGGFGDGGMIVTNDEGVAKRARRLRIHGATAKYHHEMIGYNSRLDEIQAAVLLVKLKYLDTWTKNRRRVADIYHAMLSYTEINAPHVSPETKHVYNQYTIRLRGRDQLAAELKRQDVASSVYYPLPLNRQPALSYLPSATTRFLEADRAALEVLSLPIYPELSEADALKVVSAIGVYLKGRIR